MKQFYKLMMPLALIVAMAFPANITAQTETLVVANGTTTNSYVPVYGLYVDDYVRSQSVYPATMLVELTAGDTILGLTFFSSNSSVTWSGASFDVKLQEIADTTLSSSNFVEGSPITVYSGSLEISNNQMTVEFSTPYIYQGGNLLVEIVSTATGTWSSCSFYGIDRLNASRQGYNASSVSSIIPSQRNFLPKMEITYAWGVPPTCFRVKDLTASIIDSNEITINWLDTLNYGASYNIAYWSASGDTAYTTSTDTFVTIYNLNPATQYFFAVVPDCNDGSEVVPLFGNFTTSCGTVSAPYSTGFEGLATGQLPLCWQQLMSGSSSASTFPSAYNYASNARNGNIYFEFESNSGETELAALPPMDNINSLAFTFYASLMNHNFVLEVGVMEGSTFVPVDTIDLVVGSNSNWHGSYNPYTVYFSNYYGTGNRIAIRVTSTGSYTLMMDDFSVEEFYGCYPVSNLTISDIDSASATLTWSDDLNNGVNYTVSWWNGNDTLVDYASTNSYTITNLGANTLYSVSVMADCGNDLSSALEGSFRTSCGTSPIPFSEGFEGLSTMTAPTCWTSLSGMIYVRSSSSSVHSGSYYLDFRGSTSSDTNNAIALPPMDMPTNQLQVRFWTRPENFTSSYCGSFGVGYMTDLNNNSTYVELANWPYNSFTAYEEKEVPMTGAPDNARIVLRQHSNSYNYYWYVDDLIVEPIPECPRPTAVNVTNIDSTELELQIIGTTGSYHLVWTNGTTTDSMDVYDSVYLMSNLNSNTAYTISAYSICNDGSYNIVPTTIIARTACGTTVIPYSENFETLTAEVAPPCWTVLSGSPSVYNSTTYANASSYSLRFNGAYTNSIALPSMDQPTGDLQVRFWTRPESYTNNYSGTFSVGYMTDIYVDSTWVEVATWTYGEFSSYEEKEVPMIGAPDNARIVLRHNPTSSSWYWFVDDLVVEPIPTCAHPVSISASNVTANTADITIFGIGDGFRIYWTDGNTLDSIDVNDTVFVLTNLIGSTNYTISAATLCADGSVTSTVSTAIRTDCENGGCDVVINMADSYGDGWNGNAINGYANGVSIFNATIPSGSSNTYTHRHCNGDTLFLSWVSGSYPSEVSFTVSVGGMQMVDGVGTNYSSNDTVLYVVGCPSCTAPTAFTIDSLSSSSATFHWTAGAFETEWEVVVAGIANVVNSESYTITGLNANSQYDVVIRAICGNDDTSFALTGSFRTECGTVAIPYMTDFEGLSNGNLPDCWRALQTGTSGSGTFPSAYNYAQNAFNGNVYFEFESSNGQTEIVALPVMDNINTLMLSFYASLMNANFVLEAGVMEGNTFVPVDTVNLIAGSNGNWHGSYHEYEVYFSNYTGTGNRIALRVTSNGSYTLMMDDLNVSLNTGCPRPEIPVVTSVLADQISVNFSGSTTGNYMLYITDGANYADSVSILGDSTYTFTGLSPVTTYTIDVHADCGTAISNPRTVSATTTMVPDTLPYSSGFEAGQDVSWMLVNGGETNKWAFGSAVNNGGSNALYISNDNGVSNSYSITSASNVYAIKLFSFDAGDYAISYDWMANGESCCDYMRVFLAPGTVDPEAGNAGGIGSTVTPSGWIALDGGNKLNQSSTWQNHSEVISVSTAGNYILVFFWHNDQSVGTNPPASIDNVQVAALSCPQPQNITFTSVTDVTATIQWTPVGNESQWEVVCNGNTNIVSTPSTVITGLDALHSYTVEVRAICGMGDTSFATSANFITDICPSAVTVDNFDSTANASTSSYGPIGYSLYNYSYVQTIIDSAYLASLGGDITAFAFYPASTSAGTYFTNMDVYMANVSESDLSSGFIMPDSNHTFVQVLTSADLSYSTTDEQIVSMDVPFTWDGHSNIMIAFNRQHGAWTSGSSFNAHTHSASKMRYVYQDGSAYNPTTVSGGTATTTVGDIRLISCGAGCNTPAITSVSGDVTSATFQWRGNATAYEVAIAAGNWVEPTTATTVAGNTYTFEGLTPTTRYSVGVRAVCDEAEGIYSEWVVDTVTTAEQPCPAPTGVTVSDVALTGATISWTPASATQNDFEVNITAVGVDTIVSATGTSATVTGLPHNTDYVVKVRANCGYGTYSDWSETATFHTLDCQTVTGVTVTETTQTTASVSWTSNGSASYEVAYGIVGTTTDQCARMTVTTNSCVITGLEPGVSYVVYVRSVCAEGVVSEEWSTGNNFTTQDEVGIADVDNASISLYPNPATSTVTLTGIEGEAEVSVVDMNGRQVYSGSVKEGSLSIDVSGLSQGAYFVRVTGEKVNAIRKLIVR